VCEVDGVVKAWETDGPRQRVIATLVLTVQVPVTTTM